MIRYVQTKPINFPAIETAFADSIKTNTFTNNGPLKQRLERILHAALSLDSSKRVVCTSSGTSALYIACILLEQLTGKSLSWVTPAFNFPAATVNRLDTQIVDIELDTYSIPLSYDGSADGYIIPTLFGTTPDLGAWTDKCKSEGKYLILDNASSPLSNYKSTNINMYGDISIGSLHHTKYLGYGEGGFLVVNKEHEALVNALLNFGFQDSREFQAKATNGKMSDVAAAFIAQHLSSYDIDKHLEIQAKYLKQLEELKTVHAFNYDAGVVYGNMPLIFDEPMNHLTFRDVGIEANKYYKPLAELPNTKWLYDRIINLPLHAGLSNYEIDVMFKKVKHEANIT